MTWGPAYETHVSRSFSDCNEECIEVLGLQSGVGGDQLRPRLARKAQGGTAVPSVQALIHRHAQFKCDALWNIQPMQFIVEDGHQTAIKLPYTSDDSNLGVQDPLQLVSRTSRRVREQCVAVIYPAVGHERVDYCSRIFAAERTSYYATRLTQLKEEQIGADCRYMLLRRVISRCTSTRPDEYYKSAKYDQNSRNRS